MAKYGKKALPDFLKKGMHKVFHFFVLAINVCSPALATKLLHLKTTGRWLDLASPRDFNEKLQWLKFNEDPGLKSVCADKYAVYSYIEKNHDSSILNNLIAVYNKPSEIIWDDLPDKFALKCTHGCGYNIVTKNKRELNFEDVYIKLNKWMGEKFGRKHLEYHYDLIKPKIIVEEYIENQAGLLPLDYKIYCFNGVAKLVLVCSEREDGLKLNFFDLDWNRMAIGHEKDESSKEIDRPKCFHEMVRHAEALAKPFKFVRVDFYDKDGVPIFGEMTFTPAANMATYYNEYGLNLLGEMLVLEGGGRS